MIIWNDYLRAKAHHADLLRQAEDYRLTKLATQNKNAQARSHRRVLAWLGYQLVTHGSRLLERYDGEPLIAREPRTSLR